MYGRCERPFFIWSCTRSRKTIYILKHMEWSDARLIAYIRTCARVLLIESLPCYERTLSTRLVETSFNTLTNI